MESNNAAKKRKPAPEATYSLWPSDIQPKPVYKRMSSGKRLSLTKTKTVRRKSEHSSSKGDVKLSLLSREASRSMIVSFITCKWRHSCGTSIVHCRTRSTASVAHLAVAKNESIRADAGQQGRIQRAHILTIRIRSILRYQKTAYSYHSTHLGDKRSSCQDTLTHPLHIHEAGVLNADKSSGKSSAIGNSVVLRAAIRRHDSWLRACAAARKTMQLLFAMY